MAKEEGNTDLLTLPFPRKIWTMVQKEAFQSVNGSNNGDSIMIKVDLFQRQVLHRRATGKIFETENLESFIHQLYRHGFRKIHAKAYALKSAKNNKMMVFHDFYFQRDKPEFLQSIMRNQLRKPHLLSKAQSPVTSAVEQGSSSKKVKLLPTRHSPRFPKTEDNDMKSQQEGPNNQSPSGNLSTVPSSKCNQSSMPVCAPDNCPPQETSGPRGEGTCDNDTVPALANVKMGEAGHMPRSSSGYLGYGYVMSLYNTCCYILIAALSAISLSESTEEEEDQEKEEEKEEEGEEEEEEYSENTCIICALFKNKTAL